MPTTPQGDRTSPEESSRRGALHSLIGCHVISSLGRPEHMRKVHVYPVGHDTFRVNVEVGENAATARIAESFFLTADSEGNILASTPKIVRMYRAS